MLRGVRISLQSALSRAPRPLYERVGALLHRSPRLRSVLHSTLLKRMQFSDVEISSGPAKGLRFNASGGPAGYVLGDVEPAVQVALEQVLSPGDVFYDVGASIGFFTVLGARLVGPEGHVLAVEPFPETVRRLRHNVELNGFETVTIEEGAAADHSGQGTFVGGEQLVWGTLVDGEDADNPNGIAVRVLTIDGLVAQGPAPSVIKLDIEGAEVLALQGAQDTLSRVRPAIVCETHGTRDEVVAALERHDYVVTALDGAPLAPKGPEAGERLSEAWFDHVLARPRE
jgi:FkbM family methyltransferase